MTAYTLRPASLAWASAAHVTVGPRPRHGGGRGKPPVRHRPALLSGLLIAYLVGGCACSIVHLLS